MRRSYLLFTLTMLLPLSCGDDGDKPAATTGSGGSSSTATPTTSTDPSATGNDSSRTTGSSSATDTSTDGATTDPTGAQTGTDTGLLEEIDCAQLSANPLSTELITGPRGYHGLAITPDGRMLGSDGTSLIASSYDGSSNPFLPGIGLGEQMDWLADGDLAYATDDGALTRVRLDGTTATIRSNMNAYSVVVGPDDYVYVVPYGGGNGGQDAVIRVDPETGDVSQIVGSVPAAEAHSLGFNPDWSRLYIGTIGDAGAIYYVDLDANLNATSGVQVLTGDAFEPGGFGNWHDAVAVDACGNLYVPDYESSNVFKITPGGTTTLYWEPDAQIYYAHGLLWGTGSDGWRADALYAPQPYNDNTVTEIVVGVPSRTYAGPVINMEAEL